MFCVNCGHQAEGDCYAICGKPIKHAKTRKKGVSPRVKRVLLFSTVAILGAYAYVASKISSVMP